MICIFHTQVDLDPIHRAAELVAAHAIAPHPFSGPPETLAVSGQTQLLELVGPVGGRREIA